MQLEAALHPQGTKGEPRLLGAVGKVGRAKVARKGASPATVANSTGAGRAALSPLAVTEELTTAQWNRLIARIATLPAPTIATKPSPSAIPDH